VLLRHHAVIVADWVLGLAEGMHHIEWRWPFAFRFVPNEPENTEGLLRVSDTDVSWRATADAACRVVQRTRAPSYGQAMPTSVLECEATVHATAFAVLTVFSTSGQRQPQLRVGAHEARATFFATDALRSRSIELRHDQALPLSSLDTHLMSDDQRDGAA